MFKVICWWNDAREIFGASYKKNPSSITSSPLTQPSAQTKEHLCVLPEVPASSRPYCCVSQSLLYRESDCSALAAWSGWSHPWVAPPTAASDSGASTLRETDSQFFPHTLRLCIHTGVDSVGLATCCAREEAPETRTDWITTLQTLPLYSPVQRACQGSTYSHVTVTLLRI